MFVWYVHSSGLNDCGDVVVSEKKNWVVSY